MSVEIDDEASEPARSVPRAMLRGFLCRCPNCSEGAMFAGYLSVAPECGHCGEDLSGEEAHDFPPYVTIFIVGHVVVTLLMIALRHTDWSMATHLVLWSAVTVAMCLALMRPVKGAVVGLQWALGMAGFGAKA